jgi:hypothetical protein
LGLTCLDLFLNHLRPSHPTGAFLGTESISVLPAFRIWTRLKKIRSGWSATCCPVLLSCLQCPTLFFTIRITVFVLPGRDQHHLSPPVPKIEQPSENSKWVTSDCCLCDYVLYAWSTCQSGPYSELTHSHCGCPRRRILMCFQIFWRDIRSIKTWVCASVYMSISAGVSIRVCVSHFASLPPVFTLYWLPSILAQLSSSHHSDDSYIFKCLRHWT